MTLDGGSLGAPGELWHIVGVTLAVAGGATLAGALLGIPLGAALALGRYPGKRFVRTLVYTLYGFPPIVAGLLVYLLLRGDGPLGTLRLLFTPWAMTLAEFLLVLPLVTGLTMTAVSAVPAATRELLLSLGATPRQQRFALLAEARAGVLGAVMVGFGRALAEVGAALLVGGNIRFETRTLGTAIVQETRQGEFEFAATLALLLLALSFLTFYALSKLAPPTVEAPR